MSFRLGKNSYSTPFNAIRRCFVPFGVVFRTALSGLCPF
jgi:hypothetical protein